ncbi:MAG TPA: TadE/TadG family type IV pilus assembly protein [Candidatus Binatia bacterium]
MNRDSEKGQALAEFALMLPLFALLLMPTIDFGRVFYFGMTLTQAVRAGAQYGISQDVVSADPTAFATIAGNIKAAAVATGSNIGLTTAQVTTADRYWRCGGDPTSTKNTNFPIPADQCVGDTQLIYVRVIATSTLTTMFSYSWLSSSWTLTKSAEMRVQ